MNEDPAKVIDFEDKEFVRERCEFKRIHIYEHIDDNIRAENAFRAWLASNDSYKLDYTVLLVDCVLCIGCFPVKGGV